MLKPKKVQTDKMFTMMKESLSHLVRRDQIGSVDAPPIQKGLEITDGFIPPPHPPFNNKNEKEASLC